MMGKLRGWLLSKLIGNLTVVANVSLENVRVSRPLDYFDGAQYFETRCHSEYDNYIVPIETEPEQPKQEDKKPKCRRR